MEYIKSLFTKPKYQLSSIDNFVISVLVLTIIAVLCGITILICLIVDKIKRHKKEHKSSHCKNWEKKK